MDGTSSTTSPHDSAGTHPTITAPTTPLSPPLPPLTTTPPPPTTTTPKTTTTTSTTTTSACDPSPSTNIWLQENVAPGYQHTFCSQVFSSSTLGRKLWRHKILVSFLCQFKLLYVHNCIVIRCVFRLGSVKSISAPQGTGHLLTY